MPKDIKIILGLATCRRLRMTPRNRFWGELDQLSDKEVIPAVLSEFYLISFGELIREDKSSLSENYHSTESMNVFGCKTIN